MPATVPLTELYAKTGEHVRLAGKTKTPMSITDRERLVAVSPPPAPASSVPEKRHQRVILPEYAALLGKAANAPGNNVLDDLDAVRSEC
ncbi:hypothetical protein Ga0100231_007975 [Opitutaceae bacterium TAV4]|nr:hypothetical protein Ga0100231_007975 [Opitutaceae bacterium TAV4]RRJ98396.1 hypothetical protein Ga0100230_008245 [Opitutaceae bacterium TAV3]